MDFLDERDTGSFTNRCSRSDLLAIAWLMPRRDAWGTAEFDQQKNVVKQRFSLGNRQFSIALDRIQKNREMRAILGMESQLVHLTDNEIVWVVEQWRSLHPVREQRDSRRSLRYFASEGFAAIIEDNAVRQEVASAVQSRLSRQALADLEAIFYLTRDAAYYENSVAKIFTEHTAKNAPEIEILHLMDKTNFLQCLQGAVARLGRLSLAEHLKELGMDRDR